MSKIERSPELMMFIEITGRLSVALIEFSHVYAQGKEIEEVRTNLEAEILRGNPCSLKNVSHLKHVYEVRDKSLLKGLIVLKLLFERGLNLLNKLIEVAEKDASN